LPSHMVLEMWSSFCGALLPWFSIFLDVSFI
jgi:hypothetical protein